MCYRYHEAMTEIMKLQNKQLEINELLNLSLKEFDDNMQLTNNAKILFDSEINIANQRRLIYQSSLNEIKNLGTYDIVNLNFILHLIVMKINELFFFYY